MTAPAERPVPHRPVPHRTLVAAGVAVLSAAAIVTVIAVVPAPADVLVSAREQRAVCLVQRDSAPDATSRQRAVDCVTDMDRVIAKLEAPAPTPSPTPVPAQRFPTAATAGVPSGWVPKTTRTGTWRITTAGTYEDVKVDGDISVEANNVTLRRVLVNGGPIHNLIGSTCHNGLILEAVTVRHGTALTRTGDSPSVGDGGYTARNVAILGTPEGFRVGGRSSGCGPVSIANSYARITPPDVCGDWHGDGVQGYDGNSVAITNSTVDFQEQDSCSGTAPYFVPLNQGNLTVAVDGLLVKGGGFSFRLGVPGTVKGLRIVDGAWGYGPIDVRCSLITSWEAAIVTIDATGQVVDVIRSLPCGTEGGR